VTPSAPSLPVLPVQDAARLQDGNTTCSKEASGRAETDPDPYTRVRDVRTSTAASCRLLVLLHLAERRNL